VDRRFRKWFALASAFLVFSLASPSSDAAPKDAAALKLADDAINTDYLATNFAEAEKKLRRAIAMCAGNACTAQVRAKLHRDLGVVLVAGLNRTEDGKKAFAEALRADPSITLEKDLTTPEIEQAFQAARGGGGAAAPAAPSGPAGAGTAGVSGDMKHTPPTEQVTLTPLPIYVELGDGVTPAKVVVRYKPFGVADWKTLELRKVGNGYGGEIPCQDVGSTTGDLSYYVQATDAAGDVVATSGMRNAPIKVAIKSQIAGEALHLPGRPAPARCSDKADCPPGFPGCTTGKKKTGGKGWGASCEKDRECGEGLACKNGACDLGEKAPGEEEATASSGKPCETSAECESGETCSAEKTCELPSVPLKRLWISASIQQDLSLIASQNDVCGNIDFTPPAQFTCYNNDGTPYIGIPEPGGMGYGNAIKGGGHLSTTRFLLGIDYLLGRNLTLGARAGIAIGVGPDSSSIHGELRLAYWLGRDPFRRKALRPYLALLGGFAAIDDKFDVPVDDRGRPFHLTVWHKSGAYFAGAAGGAMIPLGNNHGVLAELRVQALFPNVGVAVSPSVGYSLGF